MNTATRIDTPLPDFSGNAALYRLDPPMDGVEHVIVSAIDGSWATETYIFPADPSGEVTDWGELSGSYKGGTDHAEALRGAGYEIA